MASLSKSSGKKPALVFLHGFRGNGVGLSELANYLPEYDCHFPPLPPAGGNSLPIYNSNYYSDFVARYIAEQQLDRPIVIGHSMGSIVASAVATRYAKITGDKLVLMSPISTKPAKFFAKITPLSAVLPNKFIGYITTKFLLGKKGKKKLKQILATTYVCGADYTTKKDVYRSAQFSANHSVDDFRFKKDTLLLAGEQDRLIKPKATIALGQKIGAQVVLLKNTGHLHNYEAPKATALAIKKFLES